MRRSVFCAAAAVCVFGAKSAHATNITEFPDNGSEQMARGGAWIARASDPLATYFNPAGLAGQATRFTVQANIDIEHTCFTRLKSANDQTFVVNGSDQDPLLDASRHYPRVCNDIAPQLNPQIGFTYRVNDRLGIGALVIAPSSTGTKTFPEFENDGTGAAQAPPNRYLVIKSGGIILNPTVGFGYEVVDNLRLGASFSWGIAKLKLSSAATALNTDGATAANDLRAEIQAADYFIPGFTLGALWSATPEIDIAGWYKWSDAIRASGDIGSAANYYTKENAAGNDSKVRYGDTIFPDCGTGLPTTACGNGDNVKVKFVIPMEAKLGIRYHKLRARPEGEEPKKHLRDPMATDVFDLEANLTWANDSAADTIQVRFPGDATGRGLLPVAGVAGGEIPPNVDQYRGYHDVFGIRVGGDYNVLPDRLAIRGGGFFESSGQNPQYQDITFVATERFGLSLGGTYRLKLGNDAEGKPAPAIEFMVGYGHVFYGTQSREDPKANGILGVAGTSCNSVGLAAGSTDTCADGTPRYRTKWPVNLGTITNSVNAINVGVAYKF